MRSRTSCYIIAAIVFSIAAMISCNKNNDVAATVSFSKDIIPIFTASCALNSGCHSGSTNSGNNLDLDSAAAYNTIVSKTLVNTSNPTASLLYVEVNSGIMPKAPYSLLTTAQITLILNWIKQGAKNN